MWAVGVILYRCLAGSPPFLPVRACTERSANFSGPQWRGISDNAKDLISRLLTKNENDRINAKDALEHPWFDALEHYLFDYHAVVQRKAGGDTNWRHRRWSIGSVNDLNSTSQGVPPADLQIAAEKWQRHSCVDNGERTTEKSDTGAVSGLFMLDANEARAYDASDREQIRSIVPGITSSQKRKDAVDDTVCATGIRCAHKRMHSENHFSQLRNSVPQLE
jgi:serine/threonine protein kinase